MRTANCPVIDTVVYPYNVFFYDSLTKRNYLSMKNKWLFCSMGTARFAVSQGYILMDYHVDMGRGRVRAVEIGLWEKQK
jgi:hypothetical protein